MFDAADLPSAVRPCDSRSWAGLARVASSTRNVEKMSRNACGKHGLLRDGVAVITARVTGPRTMILAMVGKNSIFVAQMITHSPRYRRALGMIGGFATIRAGQHRHHPGMNHQGVGQRPDNDIAPADPSDFERSHLRASCVVIRGMQSAAGPGKDRR